MISLLLTLFISLFTLCSVNYPLKDQEVNNVLIEHEVVQKDAYTFAHGESYILDSEMTSGSFYLEFLQNMPTTWTDMQPSNYNNGSGAVIEFDGIDGRFWSVKDSQIYQNLGACTFIELTRNNIILWQNVQAGAVTMDIVESQYHFKFYSARGGTLYYYMKLYVSFPLVDNTYGSLGMQVIRSDFASALGENYWCYFENPTTGFAPFYTYVLEPRTERFEGNSYQNGFNAGVTLTETTAHSQGWQEGYAQALADTADTNSVANTIFTGIFDVGLLPINVFLSIFNFELFGVNISGILSGLLTLSVVVIILRFLLGGKKDDK